MANIIASPTRYIQGKGELQNLRQHVEMLGKKLFILTTASGQARVAPAINASVAGSDCTAVYEPFHGECSQSEIDRVVADFQASGCDLIVGVGGGKTTLAAMALARLCYDTLMADGRKAAVAAKAGACTKALENIVEANTYLSGIGFESGGLAGAHAIHNGLTAIPETHAFYHGEKVAFGTLVQLVLEDEHFEQIQEVVRFCTDVGLPTTLADLGIAEIKPEQIHAVAELACAPSDTLGNMPFAVTPDAVYDAILGADAIGRKYKELHA